MPPFKSVIIAPTPFPLTLPSFFLFLQRWQEQEPINAHSHIASILSGGQKSIPVKDGKLHLGRWNSVMLIDFDGPRERIVTFTIVS